MQNLKFHNFVYVKNICLMLFNRSVENMEKIFFKYIYIVCLKALPPVGYISYQRSCSVHCYANSFFALVISLILLNIPQMSLEYTGELIQTTIGDVRYKKIQSIATGRIEKKIKIARKNHWKYSNTHRKGPRMPSQKSNVFIETDPYDKWRR